MRFILGIDSHKTEPKTEMSKIIQLLEDKVATIVCIDETNTNQFYSESGTGSNDLTEVQINKFSEYNKLNMT